MAQRPIDAASGRLRALHDVLWDPEAGLVRVPSGAEPGVDLTAWQLHSVRETALGALVDLRDDRADRASVAIGRVLECQYLEDGLPWSGTFKVCAEEADPP